MRLLREDLVRCNKVQHCRCCWICLISNVETGVWEEFRFRRPTKEEEDMHLITDQMTWEDIDALQRVERRKQLLGDAYEGVVRKETEAREAAAAQAAAEALVYGGADVNEKDKFGYTVLMKEAHALQVRKT